MESGLKVLGCVEFFVAVVVGVKGSLKTEISSSGEVWFAFSNGVKPVSDPFDSELESRLGHFSFSSSDYGRLVAGHGKRKRTSFSFVPCRDGQRPCV